MRRGERQVYGKEREEGEDRGGRERETNIWERETGILERLIRRSLATPTEGDWSSDML